MGTFVPRLAFLAFPILGLSFQAEAAPRRGACFLHNNPTFIRQYLVQGRKPKADECPETTKSGMDGSSFRFKKADINPIGNDEDNSYVLVCNYELESYFGTPLCPECLKGTCHGLCRSETCVNADATCKTKEQCMSDAYGYRKL